MSAGAVVGIERGVAHTTSTSGGTHSNIPALTDWEQDRFLALERLLARQVKGSNRREATKKSLNRPLDRMRNRRRDWIDLTTLVSGELLSMPEQPLKFLRK